MVYGSGKKKKGQLTQRQKDTLPERLFSEENLPNLKPQLTNKNNIAVSVPRGPPGIDAIYTVNSQGGPV